MSLVPQPIYRAPKKFLIELFMWFLVLLAAIPLVYSLAPVIEGRLFPVLTDFIITDVVTDGTIEIYGSYEKTRDCTIIQRQWYAGTPDTFLTLLYTNQPINKTVGTVAFGPLFLNKEKVHEANDKIYGIAVYKCHPLWNITVKLGPIDLHQYYNHPFIIPPNIFNLEK